MLRACEEAESSILLEEFILEPDEIGRRFTDVFIRRAEEGLEVRLLLDGFGCRALMRSDLNDRLEAAGVKVRYFRPAELRWRTLIRGPFPRDHRKLLILDRQKTFVGGVCIYDEISDWRDTMVEVDGPLTRQFTHVFEGMWDKVAGDETEVEAHPDFETNSEFSVYANAPDSDEHCFTDELISRIEQARDSIRMTTPFFTPGSTLLPALEGALARGVKTEIILSDYSYYAPYVVGKRLCGDLIRRGAEIYFYEPQMLHLKTMIIDAEWAAIGSCNLDGLSIHENQEAMLASTQPAFVQALDRQYDDDLASSARFTLTDWQARPLHQKLAGWLLSPFRRYL